MPKVDQGAKELRSRLSAWLRYYATLYEHHYGTQTAFADALGISTATLSNVLNGRRYPGIDVAVALHRAVHVPLDLLVDTDPPEQAAVYAPAPPPRPPPTHELSHLASRPSPAPGPRKRKRQGGT